MARARKQNRKNTHSDRSCWPAERVLDLACGTGVVARLAAKKVSPEGHVTGVDINGGVLVVARSLAPAEAAIEWLEASAENTNLPDASFDVVLCQQGQGVATLAEVCRSEF